MYFFVQDSDFSVGKPVGDVMLVTSIFFIYSA